jgi:hypothetical protein
MVLRRHSLDHEIDLELTAHIDHKRDALMREGFTPAEAERTARMVFGNKRLWQEEVQSAWSLVWLETFFHDIRFGWRTLARDPLFTFFAVTTLAPGFGATTAVFSLINGLLSRSLPVPDADRLAEVHMTKLSPDVVQWVDGRKVAMREMTGAPYGVMQALAGEASVAGEVLGCESRHRSGDLSALPRHGVFFSGDAMGWTEKSAADSAAAGPGR